MCSRHSAPRGRCRRGAASRAASRIGMPRARPWLGLMARRRASEDACAGCASMRRPGPSASGTRDPRADLGRAPRAAEGDPAMLNNTLTTAALGLAVLFPGAFAAVASNGGTAIAAADDTSRVWVEGHYESRELRELVPEQTRRAWVPARHEGVRVPERTGRVYVPPVIRRVRLPGVTERVWVPDETGRRWQHAYLDLDGWHPGHWEDRVVRRGHWEDRVVREGGY